MPALVADLERLPGESIRVRRALHGSELHSGSCALYREKSFRNIVMDRDQSSSTILLVDDERRFADSLARRLQIRRYRCKVAYDGESALGLLGETSFLAMVLDLRLPGLHGTEVLARAKDRLPDLPVIILTAHGNDEDEKLCLKRGALAFMQKPLDFDRLMEILSELEAAGA
jgi:DNA-binding NtrC family response regulator